MIRLVALGFGGALSFTIGGALVFFLFSQIIQGNGPPGEGVGVFSFLGFLLVGLGLVMIVQDGKTENKPNASKI